MSGKPGKKKPVPKPGSKKPTSDPAAQKKRKPKPKPTDADSPFESAPAKAVSAIQAAPKPMKGRLLKVVCPMCDTDGFIPRKAAGRDIRCANKKCMVPVFKAPAPEKKTVVEPETQSSSTGAIIGGVLALAVVGGVVYALVGGKEPEEKKAPPVASNGRAAEEKAEKTFNERNKKTIAEESGPIPLPELRQQILKALDKSAAERNDDKPFCRLMTTEALAAAGEIERARTEANLIAKPGDARYHLRAIAFAEIAWASVKAGDNTGATEAAQEAAKAAEMLPSFGRTEFDVRTSVSAALAGTGQFDEAVAFMSESTRDLSDPLTYASAVASAEAAIRTAFVDAPGKVGPIPAVADWTNPAWVATSLVLCAHDKPDIAVRWAAKALDASSRSDALAAVGGFAAGGNRTDIASSAVQSASSDGPAAIARVNAAIAYGAATGKHDELATTSLTGAIQALGQVPEPAPVTFNGPRELYAFEAPEVAPSKLAAIAAAEVARAEAELGKGGPQTLLRAIRHAHSFCPSPKFIDQRLEDTSLTAEQLARQLRVSESQARNTFIKFNAKVKVLAKLADERRDIQASFLGRLAESKLADSVWKLVNPSAPRNAVSNELFSDSELPWKVAAGFMRSGRAAEGKAISDQLGEADSPALVAEISSLLDSTRPDQVAASLSPHRESRPERVPAVYDFTERYAEQDLVEAMAFARNIGNENWRREALRLMGTRLARNGFARNIAEQIGKDIALVPPDRTAIYRGLVSGIELDPEYKTGPANP